MRSLSQSQSQQRCRLNGDRKKDQVVSLLIGLIIICVIAGIAYWILTQIPGIPPIVPKLVWIVVALIILIWLLQNFGSLGAGHLGRL